jgi:imidazole glycerol-phosphate synthase subunit HisH
VTSIAVVDYGAGNLTSVLKGLRAAGASPAITSEPAAIARADAIVIPGVGHFAATEAIGPQVRSALLDAARSGTPILGICLGLQFLFEGSTEAPGVPGLGLLAGECSLLPGSTGVKIPHVGWNSLVMRGRSQLLAGIEDGSQVYFTHSYAAPVTEATTASCGHGRPFAAVVERKNVCGVQFHPEKSADAGLRLLRTFVQITRSPDRPIARSC